jgi:hypothetical protein
MTRTSLIRLLGFAVLVPAVLLQTGCGGTGAVSGKVLSKSKGKAVVTGTVMMMGPDSLPHYGLIEKDGSYKVENVPAGPVKVTVSSPNPKDAAASGAASQGRSGKPTAGGSAPAATAAPSVDPEIEKNWFPLDAKVGDPINTPLKADIKRGPNQHDIVLD